MAARQAGATLARRSAVGSALSHAATWPLGTDRRRAVVDARMVVRRMPPVQGTRTLRDILSIVSDVRTFICPHCKEPTKSEVYGKRIAMDPETSIPAEYAFLQCSDCGSPVLQVREDYGGGFDEDKPGFMYPAPKRLSLNVPQELRDGYDEAVRCFEAKAYAGASVMVRRTLEGTCADQGATNGALASRLRKLQGDGKIDGMLAEWANMLRVIGNEGAHFTKNKLTREDAEDALAFAEALLDHLYVLRKRFDEFKARHAS